MELSKTIIYSNRNLGGLLKSALPLSIGILLMTVIVELLLQLLPVKTVNEYIENNIHEPVLRSQSSYIVDSIGWKFSYFHQRRINNYGFVDDRDYVPNSQPIAVIGDSYIQSSMLPYPNTIQGRLSAKFGDRVSIYSFGVPMYSLAGYLGSAEYATREFQPRAFVFLLNEGDVISSLAPQDGSYFLDRPDGELQFQEPKSPKRITQLLRTSALYRYLYMHLKFDQVVNRIIKPQSDSPDPNSKEEARDYDQVATRLLELFPQKTGVTTENTVFIIDSDRANLSKPGLGTSPGIEELLAFKKIATSKGYRVVDTQDFFTSHYRTTGQPLDLMPVDFHWNSKAHQLVADRIYPILDRMLTNP